MTTIKATCPIDGEVALTHVDISLMVCATDDTLSYYSFVCPTCTDVIRKRADEHVQSLLRSGGVKPTKWEPPKYPEEKPPSSLPALTEDDLIAFGLYLEKNL